jgi:hypothetical protein
MTHVEIVVWDRLNGLIPDGGVDPTSPYRHYHQLSIYLERSDLLSWSRFIDWIACLATSVDWAIVAPVPCMVSIYRSMASLICLLRSSLNESRFWISASLDKVHGAAHLESRLLDLLSTQPQGL